MDCADGEIDSVDWTKVKWDYTVMSPALIGSDRRRDGFPGNFRSKRSIARRWWKAEKAEFGVAFVSGSHSIDLRQNHPKSAKSKRIRACPNPSGNPDGCRKVGSEGSEYPPEKGWDEKLKR